MGAISGQKTVTAHGTAEALGTLQVNSVVMIRALPDNTDKVYVGNDGAGDVNSSNGVPLDAGEYIIMELGNLGSVMVDSEVDGEGVAWLVLSA